LKQAAFSACTRLHCTRATKPCGFRKGRLNFNTVFQHRTTERSHKNKAALLTKMPRSLIFVACRGARAPARVPRPWALWPPPGGEWSCPLFQAGSGALP